MVFDLDFIKSIVENADSQIFIHPNNDRNGVILGGGKKKFSRASG